MTRRKQTIVVSGMIAGDPHQGGATWAVLQYVLGFRRLGHDVLLIEPVAADRAGESFENSATARYFQQVTADFGLADSAALVRIGSRDTIGIAYESLRNRCQNADVLVNISGMLTDEALIASIPIRVYLDLDPAFIQMWHAYHHIDMRFDVHTHFVTIGLAIGQPGCAVPTCGRTWITTLQPIVLERWPVADAIVHDAFTTVGNFRGYGSIDHEGILYGQKVHSIRAILDLPQRSAETFLLAMAIHPAETKDLAALRSSGWRLIDPGVVARTPAAYQSFIQGSRGELGIAKSGYVASRCAWFSDRSLCYLASGRPVLAQDTGVSSFLPTGEGLLSFQTTDDILAGIEAIRCDYARHARAARHLAEDLFDSDKVLKRLLDRIGGAS